jgi:DMSO/TMAO reductase YedYZ molybdopterin-dependent catalytic subunit
MMSNKRNCGLTRGIVSLVTLGTLVLALQAFAQTPVTETVLEVSGEVSSPVSFSLAELRAMPRAEIVVMEDEQSVTYEGVFIDGLLQHAGVPMGDSLRGPALAGYMLAKASDNYQVVFSLGELSSELSGNQILLADLRNGQPLPASQGPLRIMVPGDSRASRSVRMVTELSIVQLL